jgi:O-antigen ligase
MQLPLAVAAGLQGGAAVLAALAAAAVLGLDDPRRRAWAMVGAGALAALGLATLLDHGAGDDLRSHGALVAAALAGALLAVVGLALVLRGRPRLFVALVFVTLPFRIPVPLGGDTAFLLVGLYGVIAAGVLAAVLDRERTRTAPSSRRLRWVEYALGAFVVLYAVQTLYSSDVEHAVKITCFFLVPFSVLFRLLLDIEWTRRVVVVPFAVSVGLALLFAAVGIAEYATRSLLIFNEKVLLANEIKPYFRVNSLFFDPNIYGRFVAITMVAVAGALLWRRRRRDIGLAAAALALLWAGLVVSLSESSFAALLFGLLVLAAVAWRPRPVLAAAGAAAVVLAVLVVVAPGTLGLREHSFEGVNKATSGRASLIRGGVGMARDRPLAGYGSGSFSEQFRERRHLLSQRSPAESHTIPVTIAAEQGAVGLISYAALLVAMGLLLFGGLRRDLRERPGFRTAARVVLAAAFAVLFLHTLVYAAFLEDPLTWALLAIGAGLLRAADEPAVEAGEATAVPA